MENTNRREFMNRLGVMAIGGIAIPSLLATGCSSGKTTSDEDDTASGTQGADMFFKISLAEWSLHKTIMAGELDNLDFPAKSKNDFGIDAVEYVNAFFKDTSDEYLKELKKRCDDINVRSLLIMCDNEGQLATSDAAERKKAVENHHRWVDAAAYLGCHSIRVNCFGEGTPEEKSKAAADGLAQLCTYAAPSNINIIVENHGGITSNGAWLSNTIQQVGMDNCGTLPDFGNFCTKRADGKMWDSPCVEEYDRYKGMEELMPYAKGVSAKSYDFDEAGNCVESDYERILKIVKAAGYKGYIGIEYEGQALSEADGIRATLDLLKRVGRALK